MTHFHLIRVSAIAAFIFASVALADSPDVVAALADYNRHPESERADIFYLTTRPYVGNDAVQLRQAIRLVVASNSTQPIIERCKPANVPGELPGTINPDLLRINIRDLRWAYDDWKEVAQNRNPYTRNMPLVVRADWLLIELSDQQESDSYLRLMFGGNNLPITAGDVFKFFDVSREADLKFGLIEGESGVSVQGTRLLESLPKLRGYAWFTSDVLKLDQNRDPVEHVDGTFSPDGHEGIIGIPKLHLQSGNRGALQWYFLANAKEEIVARAPVDLVQDKTEFRGLAEIRNPGSCIQCHVFGLNIPTRNEFRHLVKSGVDVFAGKGQQENLEAFHLGDSDTELARSNDDFTLAVELVCEGKPADVNQAFREAVRRYDAPLGLEQTAEELGVGAVEWTRTIATSGTVAARLASLPHGGTIPRAAWEQQYTNAYDAMYHGGTVKAPEPPKVETPKVAEQPKAVKPAVKPASPKATQARPQTSSRRGGRR